MIADTHIHVWDFKKAYYLWLDGNDSILNRNYHISEIETERKALKITNGVLVQAANNFEDTDMMLQVAEETDWINGVVGWLPLTDTAATQQALGEKYLRNKYFKGVRHLIHDEADPEWLLQPQVVESLRLLAVHNISYNIVGVLPEHLRTALKISALVPELKMVLDHICYPRSGGMESYKEWESMMKILSGNKNIYAKISGLTLAVGKGYGWKIEDLKPAIQFVLQSFGTDRCFCGGDWPVSLLAGDYTKTWNAYKHIINEQLTKKESDQVFYLNAQNFYKL
ncbi:MAG: amidohydrolase family protein [Ferruginibacter sp.]